MFRIKKINANLINLVYIITGFVLFVIIFLSLLPSHASAVSLQTQDILTITTTAKNSTPKPGTIPTSPSTVIIRLSLDLSFQDFTQLEQEKFIANLARILSIKQDNIHILLIEKGSVLMTLEIPSNAAQNLRILLDKKDSQLLALKIIKIESLPTPTGKTLINTLKTTITKSEGKTSHTSTKTPSQSKTSPATPSNILTTLLLILAGIFLLTVLGIGGFIIFRPANKT